MKKKYEPFLVPVAIIIAAIIIGCFLYNGLVEGAEILGFRIDLALRPIANALFN